MSRSGAIRPSSSACRRARCRIALGVAIGRLECAHRFEARALRYQRDRADAGAPPCGRLSYCARHSSNIGTSGRNEIEFSRANDAHFHLYRLFEFRKSPRLFDLAGPVERNCMLNPISYVGRFS